MQGGESYKNLDKSTRLVGKRVDKEGVNIVSTLGDSNRGEEPDGYNVYLHATGDIKRHFDFEFKCKSTEELKNHYLHSREFCEHPCLDLVMKMYALIKNLELNQKFKGYMRKKQEDMKKHYWMLPNVSALCSNEELDIFKKRKPEDIPEEITLFCFLTDVCQSVEIINNNGEVSTAFYPMLPKVYYLTQKSVNQFRAECRIEQSTTKLMDLMSYVEQFDIEMEINSNLNEKYNMISRI